MRISMWVLAQRLEKYDRTVQIGEGKRVLRNARIFSDELRLSRSTVYVSQPQPGRVLCSNGQDCIVLRADDVNEVFNDILDVFENCNDISGEAYDLVATGCSARVLLEKGVELMGRAIILADATFYMREIVDHNGALQWNKEDLDAAGGRMLPLDSLLSISALPQIRIPNQPTYPLKLEGMAHPAAVMNLFVRGRHRGWLITVGGTEAPDQGTLDLQDGFAEIVTTWLEARDEQTEQMERAGIFPELLEKGPGAAMDAARRLRMFGWYPEDRKLVYAIGPAASGPDQTPLLERRLEQLYPNAFAFRAEEHLYYILDRAVTPLERLEGELRDMLSRCGCAAGKSPEFSGIEHLEDCCRAAEVSLRFAGQTPGRIVEFSDAVLPYVSELLRQRSAVELRHPALAILTEYDAAHEGALKETLAVFLQKECSYADTAQALYIHRSTLLYRLQRIKDLTGVTLEDARERLHLRISLLMEEARD